MRKRIHLALLCCLCSAFAFSQDSLKAVGGRVTTELNVNPFQGELSLNNALNQIKIRCFTADNFALRIAVSLESKKNTAETKNPYGTNPYNLKDERKTSTVGLSFGFEKHFTGTKRLSPYLGAEAIIASKNSKHDRKENTNEYHIKGAWQTTSGNPGGPYVYTYEERAFLRYGLNLIGGFDFYVARHLYIGYEIAFALTKTDYKDIEITTKPVSTVPNPDIQQEDSSIGPNLVNGIRLGFVF